MNQLIPFLFLFILINSGCSDHAETSNNEGVYQDVLMEELSQSTLNYFFHGSETKSQTEETLLTRQNNSIYYKTVLENVRFVDSVSIYLLNEIDKIILSKIKSELDKETFNKLVTERKYTPNHYRFSEIQFSNENWTPNISAFQKDFFRLIVEIPVKIFSYELHGNNYSLKGEEVIQFYDSRLSDYEHYKNGHLRNMYQDDVQGLGMMNRPISDIRHKMHILTSATTKENIGLLIGIMNDLAEMRFLLFRHLQLK